MKIHLEYKGRYLCGTSGIKIDINTINITNNPIEVTCKSCLKKL